MPFDSSAFLRDIAATPRPAGSAALATARDRCARELRDMGFDVRELPFGYSGFPGRLATPVLGGAAAALVGYAGRFGASGSRFAPLLVLGLGVALLLGAGWWLMRRGVLDAPLLRDGGVNLEATRPGARPRVWLCAHLDSKSQPVPSLVRSAGIVLEGAGVALALGLSVALALDVAVHPIHWVQAAVLTLVGAVPVVLSTVGHRSPGAFDNASGVATVMAAAALLHDVAGAGVLVTDAEELGLAGARAWASGKRGDTVLNCDGVDDSGAVAVMYSGRRPAELLAQVAAASADSGVTHEAMRMIPGILTDSVAFTQEGLGSVTFSRGSLKSLLRVHSARDSLERLRGTGIAETATLVAATARRIVTGGGEWKY
jgi:hypothetical protein